MGILPCGKLIHVINRRREIDAGFRPWRLDKIGQGRPRHGVRRDRVANGKKRQLNRNRIGNGQLGVPRKTRAWFKLTHRDMGLAISQRRRRK